MAETRERPQQQTDERNAERPNAAATTARRQASAPQETSTTTCVVGNGSTLSRSAGLRNSAPSAAARKHPTASTALSRPVRGPVELGCAEVAWRQQRRRPHELDPQPG